MAILHRAATAAKRGKELFFRNFFLEVKEFFLGAQLFLWSNLTVVGLYHLLLVQDIFLSFGQIFYAYSFHLKSRLSIQQKC